MKGICSVLLIIATSALGQELNWYHGCAVLADQSIVTGLIHYLPGSDRVVVRTGEQAEVLTATEVRSFRYFDTFSKVNRKYVSINRSGYPIFFEVVVGGPVTIVRIQPSVMINPVSENGYRYFLLDHGQLTDIHRFRKDIYPRIKDAVRLKERELGLNPNYLSDIIRYIELMREIAGSGSSLTSAL